MRAIRVTYYIRVQWPSGRFKYMTAWVDLAPGAPDGTARGHAYGVITQGEPSGAQITDFDIVKQEQL
jgi:hypothetical protein